MPSFHRFVLILNRCAAMFRGERFPNKELTPCLQSYILPVCSKPGMSQDQLAKHMYINKSNVARHLAALEKMGYVERRQNESDRRVSNVYPTELAMSAREEIIEGIREWNGYIMGEFTKEESEIFYGLLSRAAERAAAYAGRKMDEDEKRGEIS